MSNRGSASKVTRPLKIWSQRFAFLALMMIAVALMALSKAQSPLADRMRVIVVDAFTPVLSTISKPVDSVSNWMGAMASASALRAENARLRGEIERLQAGRIETRQIKAENSSLRELLGAPTRVQGKHIAARVMADPGRGFVRSFLIDAGSKHGVRRGLAVVDANGLIGRITEVGENSARVLLLVDLSSRVSVRLERTRDRAILAGDNTEVPKLRFLPEDTTVKPGDRLVTSGHDGVLPAGLPVGTVTSTEGGLIQVRPFVAWSRIEFVRVLDFEPKGLVPSANNAERRLK